ncbi:MAG: arginase [Acidobacteriota bacterium]
MNQAICIIGVPMDLGQSRRGVDMGPSAIRYAGLANRLRKLGCTVRDCGNLEIPVRDTLPEEGGVEYLPAVVQACQAVYEAGEAALQRGDLPIYLGGDHSIALGTVSASTLHGRCGLIWIDAHGDFNTPETSPSGNLHGMPLAALTGRGAPPMVDLVRPGRKMADRDIMIIGVRSLDRQEREALRSSDLGVYTMRDIDEEGIARVANQALQRLSHCERIHISLDMDCLDPAEAPGVGTPVPGGITYREAHLLMEIIAGSEKLFSLEVVEVNPILDHRNRTAELSIELVASAMGKAIL